MKKKERKCGESTWQSKILKSNQCYAWSRLNFSTNLINVVFFNLVISDAAFKCPPKDGLYEDPKQCDKFYECIDGEAEEKLCPDGLVFDPTIRKINKCDQPFSVDCGDRLELQPPKSNHLCPRRNGYFAHPDESVCNIFYNCIEGEATEIVCPTGLHFDEYSGTCVWPDAAGRTGCGNKEASKLTNIITLQKV